MIHCTQQGIHRQRVRTPRKGAQEDNYKNKGANCIYKLHPISLWAPRRGDFKRQPAPLIIRRYLRRFLKAPWRAVLLAVSLTAFQRIILIPIYQEQKQSVLELHATAPFDLFGRVIGRCEDFWSRKKERGSELKLHDLLGCPLTANFPIFYENFPAPAYHTCKPLRFISSIAKCHHCVCA